VELKTAADSANYAYGMILLASAQKQMAADFNKDAFMAGLQAVANGDSTRFSVEQSTALFTEYSRTAQQKMADAYKNENMKFLEDNKKRVGVVTTPSGLQYEVMKKGSGTVSPTATDRVEVHYHGTFPDGRIFDSSVDRGKTSAFGLNQVIAGWTEGLQLMHEGDKFKFFIPYQLAYGERGRSGIKGFSTLLFEVELFKINP
ncbi:MAG: FKBP-type peptidyl-prolyl cis-trans isomerase, partial [Saprospiraceae bacterium]